MNDVRLGVLGCGTAGIDLCRAAAATEGVRVIAVFDPDVARARHVAESCAARQHASAHELLADDGLDAVYVAVPHHLLAPLVDSAIEAGRHVLAEKPLALDQQAAIELGHLAARRDVRLGVNFALRQTAPVRSAREAVGEGAIGTIRAVRIRTVVDKPLDYWSAGAPPGSALGWRASRAEAGGGVVLMNSIHLLDVVRFVTGLEFTRAMAEVATFTPGVEVEDSAAAVLRLSNGAIVSLTAAAHSAGADSEELISIDGSGGRIDLPYLLGLQPARLYVRRPWPSMPAGWTEIDAPPRDCFQLTLERFLDAVRQGCEPTPNATDAAAALGVVAAVYKSADLGRSVGIGGDGGSSLLTGG